MRARALSLIRTLTSCGGGEWVMVGVGAVGFGTIVSAAMLFTIPPPAFELERRRRVDACGTAGRPDAAQLQDMISTARDPNRDLRGRVGVAVDAAVRAHDEGFPR